MTSQNATASTPSRIARWAEAVRVYGDRRLIAVLFMGFASGLPLALTAGTLQVWQTRAGVDLTTVGFFVLVGVVYSLKFVWAPFMDRVSPPWFLARLGHRRGWAILTQFGLMATIPVLGFSDPVSAPAVTALCAVLVAFCSASQDIVVDAYRIELLDEHQQGAGAAMTQYGYRVGMLASGAGALFLHRNGEGMDWSGVYIVMAGLMTIGMVTVLMTREPKRPRPVDKSDAAPRPHSIMRLLASALLIAAAIAGFILVKYVVFGSFEMPNWGRWIPNVSATLVGAAVPLILLVALPRPKSPDGRLATGYADLRDWLDGTVVAPFRDVAKRDGWVLILVFIVLFKLGDAVVGVMANPFYVRMGFTDEEIALASKTFGLIATLIGIGIGGLLVARLGSLRALLIGGVIQMLSNLMFAAQSVVGHDVNFLLVTIGIENLSGGIGAAAFVAYISGLCNLTFTGTQYALFSSFAVIGRTVLASPGGLLQEMLGWFNYFLLATALAVPGLILLLWMMKRFPVVAAPRPES